MLLKLSLHPRGLHPIEAVKAWQLSEEGETLQVAVPVQRP